MTTPADHADARDGLMLLLGPRQAEMMRLFWSHGPATVRQVQQWLATESDLAYTTVATLCGRLIEKGLLRQRVEESDRRAVVYVYTPRISEADFVRAAVTQQLDRLLAHYSELVYAHVTQHAQPEGAADADVGDRANVEHVLANRAPPRDASGQQASAAALDTVAALIERAVAAEHQAATWETQARRAQRREQTATARLEKVEARAVQWEATAHRVEAQALAAEEDASAVIRRVALQQHAARRSAPEWFDPAGVCRVCNQPVSDVPARRRDGLRVCAGETCRQEARRRDRAAKQRQQRARWRQRRERARTLAG